MFLSVYPSEVSDEISFPLVTVLFVGGLLVVCALGVYYYRIKKEQRRFEKDTFAFKLDEDPKK